MSFERKESVGMLKRQVLYSFLAAWLVLPAPAAHGQGRYSADEVKAAFLYNFPGFVTWPSEARPGDGVVIGIMNAEEVETELRRIVGSRSGRAVSVRRVSGTDDTAGVHVLFVGGRENARLARILQAVRQSPVLTVTETPEGLDQGSIINFITTDRVQFEISTEAAMRSGLHLNARLLSVALRIRKGEFPGESGFALAARVVSDPTDIKVSTGRTSERKPRAIRLLTQSEPGRNLRGRPRHTLDVLFSVAFL